MCLESRDAVGPVRRRTGDRDPAHAALPRHRKGQRYAADHQSCRWTLHIPSFITYSLGPTLGVHRVRAHAMVLSRSRRAKLVGALLTCPTYASTAARGRGGASDELKSNSRS